jgi:hypothetical protein
MEDPMTRPVRPVALVILTACMIYPGITLLWQGLYPFNSGEYFNLVGQTGPWMMLAQKVGLPPLVVLIAKAGLGLAWIAGVLGLWAGDARAYPLALLAAAGSLLHPYGGTVMGIVGLVALLGFREDPEKVTA